VVPYFPLAGGLLTGKYRRGEDAPAGTRLGEREEIASERDWRAVEALEGFAGERGLSLLEVAIGGLAAQPGVASVIAGATNPEQVAANAQAVRWAPGEDELAALRAVLG
jgi:aryl-alcohol dehydrogenase-like predicted oxidoreductase